MREDNIQNLAEFGVVFVAARGIGFAYRVGVVVDHLAVVFFDVVEDVEQVVGGDDGEVVGLLGGVGGRIVLDYPTIFAAQRAAGFIGIARYDMRGHLIVQCPGDTHDKGCVIYHNNTASKSSSSCSISRVHRSSLRYFQPPSARITTILPRSMLAATRRAACRAAPHDGPAKMPSWSFNWRVRRMESLEDTRILPSSSD